MEVLLFFIKWGILFGLFILPLARKGVSSEFQLKGLAGDQQVLFAQESL